MAFLYAYNSSTAARAALPLCPAAQIQFSSSGSMWHTVPTRLAASCRVTPMLGRQAGHKGLSATVRLVTLILVSSLIPH
ncbi:hypothetical protein HaLaN_00698 [Haematococcus lacustris]|uniref:Uncharacterized protein n=1 Tax=Haematococcus lacustris TaxID=44745 RepID=A0A699Y9X0_HAELA|nr:hypothetical protein HaLaN_00698 [Haematococcus lacustris]